VVGPGDPQEPRRLHRQLHPYHLRLALLGLHRSGFARHHCWIHLHDHHPGHHWALGTERTVLHRRGLAQTRFATTIEHEYTCAHTDAKMIRIELGARRVKLQGAVHRLQYVKRVQQGSRLGNGVETHIVPVAHVWVRHYCHPSRSLVRASGARTSIHLHHAWEALREWASPSRESKGLAQDAGRISKADGGRTQHHGTQKCPQSTPPYAWASTTHNTHRWRSSGLVATDAHNEPCEPCDTQERAHTNQGLHPRGHAT
jgi:hypothetical protein